MNTYIKIKKETLGRIPTISLILFNLLSNNYDCTKILIYKLKDIELTESRDYHIKRFKNKPKIVSTYSFWCILKGYPYRKEQREKARRTQEREKKIYILKRKQKQIF